MTTRFSVLFLAIVLASHAQVAGAWSRSGHMITAAIAYDDLIARNPQIIAQIEEIMAKHPDRAAFEIVGGPGRGEARTRRIFLEMARWPDDIRTTPFDHPTWHYASRAIVDQRNPPSPLPGESHAGAAGEAFALNLRVASDSGATPAERAVALCWVFHLLGDVHQPLHTVDQVSARFPEGDRGGNLQFIRDPRTSEFMNLHAYWDGIVRGNGESQEAIDNGRGLAARYPRSQFPQLKSATLATGGFATWSNESFEIARKVAYRSDLSTGVSQAEGKPLTDAYVTESTSAGERQIVLAGYRLADLLRGLFPAR